MGHFGPPPHQLGLRDTSFQTTPLYSLWSDSKINPPFPERESALRIYQHIAATKAHWDFLAKSISLHYYTTLVGVLGVQRSRQAQGTLICLFGPLFFSENGMTFKKPTKIIKLN